MNGLTFTGMRVYISPLLPMRSTKSGPMRLSPFVTVSNEFRASMDVWLADLFGDAEYPQPYLCEAIKSGDDTLFVSPRGYEQIRRQLAVPSGVGEQQ